jgi:hypothetical protein
MAQVTMKKQPADPNRPDNQAIVNLSGKGAGDGGYSFSGTASDAARFSAPVTGAPAPTVYQDTPPPVRTGSDFAKPEQPGVQLLGPESGIGWKTRLGIYREDSERLRSTQANAAALEREGMSQAGQNTRQESAQVAAENLQGGRLRSDATLQQGRIDATSSLAGMQHKNDLEKMTEADKYKAAEQNRTLGAQALLAGGNESVASNLMNTAPGFQGVAKGLNIPLKNTQVDQYQFFTQDNGAGKAPTVYAGNKGTGVASQVNAAAALAQNAQGATTAAPQAQPQQPGATAAPAQRTSQPQPEPIQQPVQTPAQGNKTAPNAFAELYQKYPDNLKADSDAAFNQVDTIYKTDEERFKYLNNLRTTNPTLYNVVKPRIVAQQQALQQQGLQQ